MHISLRKKFIFLHIPKNAGSAIKVALNEAAPEDPEIVQWAQLYYDVTKDPEGLHFKSGAKILPYHGNQQNLKLLLDHIGQRVDNFFEFVIVRHPYERIKSFVKYSQVLNRINKSEILNVDDVLNLIEQGHNTFYASQFRWIDNPVSKKLHVFKCEDLVETGWKEIKYKLKLDLPDLKHVNVSPEKSIVLTDQQKNRCYELLKREFVELDYKP